MSINQQTNQKINKKYSNLKRFLSFCFLAFSLFFCVGKGKGDAVLALLALGGGDKEESTTNDDESGEVEKFVETSQDKTQRNDLNSLWNKILAKQTSPYPFSDDSKTYDQIPTASKIGIHSENFKTHALNWFNWYRTIAKIPTVTISKEAQTRAEHCATALAKLNRITHDLTNKPDNDQPKSKIERAYGGAAGDLAAEGAKNSNLYSSGGKKSFFETIDFNFTEGKLKDTGKITFNFNGMIHRFWGLNPKLSTTGIAIAHLKRNGITNTKACYKILGTGVTEKNVDMDFAAFPNGYFPIQADMRKSYANKKFPNRNAVPESEFFVKDSYTVWTVQYIAKDKLIKGKDITVTIRESGSKGKLVDKITTQLDAKSVVNGNGSLFVVKTDGNTQDRVMVIKPKHGTLSNAYNSVKDKNAVKIFHILIDGEGMTSSITYRIMYIDLKNFDIKTVKQL